MGKKGEERWGRVRKRKWEMGKGKKGVERR